MDQDNKELAGARGVSTAVKSPPVYITEEEARQALLADPHFHGLVDVVETAFQEYHHGRIVTPEQERMRLVWPPKAKVRPYERDMRVHAAMVPGVNAAGVHIGTGSFIPGSMGKSSFNVLMDYETMAPLAIIEDSYLHSVRSGVPTGIAVRHLAKDDAKVLGVIGCGKISRVQIAVALGQRDIEEVRVFSRNAERRERFAQEQADKFGVSVTPCDSSADVVTGADIVVSATNSYNTPVFDGNLLSDGCLVVAVTPGEIDAATALRGRCVISSSNRVTTDYTPQEPLASLLASGRLQMENIPTLGQVLTGEMPGRLSQDEVIFFYSPGIGFLDVIVGRHVFNLKTGR